MRIFIYRTNEYSGLADFEIGCLIGKNFELLRVEQYYRNIEGIATMDGLGVYKGIRIESCSTSA